MTCAILMPPTTSTTFACLLAATGVGRLGAGGFKIADMHFHVIHIEFHGEESV